MVTTGSTSISAAHTLFESIFKTFSTYNFTVREDEPLEREVAVDPEMLGKVFENLLEVTDARARERSTRRARSSTTCVRRA